METRVESWAVGTGIEARRGRPNRYYDPAFPIGVIEPTAANTGPRVPESSLTVYNGDVTNVAPGEVLDRLLITGQFMPNNPCTIRDSVIRGGPVAYEELIGLVDCRRNGGDPVRLEFCTLDPAGDAAVGHVGFRRGNFSAYRCKVVNVVDHAHIHGNGSWPNTHNVIVQLHACYFAHSRWYPDDPRQGPEGSHCDFVQAHGSLSLLEIMGCSFGKDGARANTSNILLQQHHGLYGRVVITDNWFYGHPTSGSTFNMSENRGVGYLDLAFHRNRIDRAGKAPRILVYARSRIPENYGWIGDPLAGPSTWTPTANASVFMDDGTPVPINKGD